ncbi:hypothetical protein ACFXTI_014674 [Malus domestica]
MFAPSRQYRMIGESPLCNILTIPMANTVARQEFTPQTMSHIKTSYTEKVRMVYYCYASAPKKVLKQSRKSMKGFAELISPDVKYGGCFDDTVIFGQEY